MSINVPNPNGSASTVPHATVVLIDPVTGLPVGATGATPQTVTGPLTDAQLRAAAVPVAGSASAGSVPTLPPLSVSGIDDAGLKRHLRTNADGALQVVSTQITSVTATIANGASVSADIDLGTARLGRIAMPAAWTAADLTLITSHNGGDWNPLYDKDGAEYTIKAAGARSALIPLSDMLSVRYLRIRSGTSAAPVNQAAARSIVLVLVP